MSSLHNNKKDKTSLKQKPNNSEKILQFKNRVEAEQRVNDQERTVGQLEAERNALVRTQESEPTAEERNTQLEERVQQELARFDEQTADGGMVRTSERLRGQDPSLSVMATADDRDAYEAALRQAGNATAEDAQLRIDRENERLDRIDTLNEEIAIKKTSVLTSDAEGQELAQEMVESRVLNDRELDALREEKHRESLGMTQEEYQAMKDAELDKEFFDPADEDGNFYQSQFLDDLQGTTLTADELRTICNCKRRCNCRRSTTTIKRQYGKQCCATSQCCK